MFLAVDLVPWKNQDVSQGFVRSGEESFVIVDGFRTGEREGPAAFAERDLVAENLTRERRLLNVAWCARDAFLAELDSQADSSAFDDRLVNSQAVLPLGVNGSGGDDGCFDSGQASQLACQSVGRANSAVDNPIEFFQAERA